MPKVYFAGDHGFFELKRALVEHVRSLGYEVEDVGAHVFDADDDYPDFITPCAKKVAADPGSFGVVGGASGQGEAIAANRIKGVRAVVYYGVPAKTQTDADGKELDMISSTREHNNANILSLGGRFISEDEAKETVGRWLATPFPGAARHARRVKKLDA
jgi:ribose 5-phosphate isomerase B